MAAQDVFVKVVENLLTGAAKKKVTIAVETIVEEVADAVADEWRRRVPVDEGDYRDSIHVEDGSHPLERIVTTDLPGDDPYDIYLEYGTVDQDPNPVAKRAANTQRKAFRTKAARKIKEAVE